jgi:hypothetical protein
MASLLIVYSPLAINFIFSILFLVLLYLNLNQYKIWIKKMKPLFSKFSIYYIILYICIVEYLPILAIFNSTIYLKK